MCDTTQLLRLIHEIADRCEEIRRRAATSAQDPAETLERRQATADLGAIIEHLFEIANYILKAPTSSA